MKQPRTDFVLFVETDVSGSMWSELEILTRKFNIGLLVQFECKSRFLLWWSSVL